MKKVIYAVITTAALTLNLLAQHQVQIPDLEAEAGVVTVPINTNGLGEIGSLTLNIGYDDTQLEFSGFENNLFEGDPNFLFNDKPGKLRIIWYNISPVVINDILLELNFNYFGGSSAIQFISANEITDPVANPLNIEYDGGSITELVTSVKEGEVPVEYSIFQNYPNPFNPSTTIRFGIPTQAAIKLTVFDILGHEIDSLVNENLPAGYHSVDFDMTSFSSGIYFYRISAKSVDGTHFEDVKKMLLIK